MKKILTILALTALTIYSQAKVRLPHIICDNMVLPDKIEDKLKRILNELTRFMYDSCV